jgi:hypothetical protein
MKITLNITDEQEDSLSELVIALEKALDCKISFNRVYEAESTDTRAIAILQSCFNNGNGQETIKPKTGLRKRNNSFYKVLDGPLAEKTFLGTSIAKMLRSGKLTEGTHLTHPKKGELIVHGSTPSAYLMPFVRSSEQS